LDHGFFSFAVTIALPGICHLTSHNNRRRALGKRRAGRGGEAQRAYTAQPERRPEEPRLTGVAARAPGAARLGEGRRAGREARREYRGLFAAAVGGAAPRRA
jgi:hypothetical protein